MDCQHGRPKGRCGACDIIAAERDTQDAIYEQERATREQTRAIERQAEVIAEASASAQARFERVAAQKVAAQEARAREGAQRALADQETHEASLAIAAARARAEAAGVTLSLEDEVLIERRAVAQVRARREASVAAAAADEDAIRNAARFPDMAFVPGERVDAYLEDADVPDVLRHVSRQVIDAYADHVPGVIDDIKRITVAAPQLPDDLVIEAQPARWHDLVDLSSPETLPAQIAAIRDGREAHRYYPTLKMQRPGHDLVYDVVMPQSGNTLRYPSISACIPCSVEGCSEERRLYSYDLDVTKSDFADWTDVTCLQHDPAPVCVPATRVEEPAVKQPLLRRLFGGRK